jgi:hypothetical protein
MITTIRTTSPEISEPVRLTLLATATPMYPGTLATGPELLPGDVLHVAPQDGGTEDGVDANPLKADGAAPPDSVFPFDHCAPQ